MSSAKYYRTEALTLKNMPLGESDLLVTLYCKDIGKLRAVAKGARKSTSKLVGHFEPLTINNISITKSTNLDIINHAETIEDFDHLKSNLIGMAQGVYINELLDGVAPESHSNNDLYILTHNVLKQLASYSQSRLPLMYFELHLLRLSGLMPELYHCVECREKLSPERHRFSSDHGGTLCLQCKPPDSVIRNITLSALKVLRLLHKSNINQLPDLKMNPSTAEELDSILRNTIQFWLDKEIRSKTFLEYLRRSANDTIYS